jgi:two-component system chemotaxis response regulator CheY
MTGMELARRIHKEPGRRDLPVILLTAHGLALEQVELNQAGIAACLSKPFSPREVLQKVQELLEKAAAEKAQAAAAAPVA